MERELAVKIIDKDLKKNKFDYIINNKESRLTILCGEFGVGKSYSVDIMFQKQAKKYLSGVDDRFPIYFKSNSINSLKTKIEEEFFFEKDSKYIIFIDGLDELDYSSANKIIDEVMFLEELWGNCRFILTTRPMSFIDNKNIKYLPVLKQNEIVEIIECITGEDFTSTINYNLDKDIKEAIERPFFCILFALSIRDKHGNFICDRNKMIDYLVNKSISKLSIQREQIYIQIIKLSIIFIDRKMERIHLSELGSAFDIENLLKCGIIYKDNSEYIYFPLPIIPQWLSAEGIRLEYKSIDEIVKCEDQIIRWRYPLSILFGKLNYNESKDIFGKVVRKYPGVAAIIIRDGIKTTRQGNLPTVNECGIMLQECMKEWIEGLGCLANVIAPIRNGKIADLGIHVYGKQLAVSWSVKNYNEDIKEVEGKGIFAWRGNVRYHAPIAQAIWPWIDTFEYLSDNLKKIIKQKPLLLDDGILLDEYIWFLSCKLTKKGSLYDKDIEIFEIEQYRKYANTSNFIFNNTAIDMKFYFTQIDRLINKGQTTISAPWPRQDIGYGKNSTFVWDAYSDKRILEKATFIYEKAIKEYLRIVERWFPLIKENLSLYSLIPVNINGYIDIDREDRYCGGPVIDWNLEVLPKDEKTNIKFNLVDIGGNQNENIDIHSEVWRKVTKMRSEKIEWIRCLEGESFLEIFDYSPVTNIVYNWLESDLKDIGWIK